ncbi:hypothetical protein ACV566_08335 [Staphylococcus aureus]
MKLVTRQFQLPNHYSPSNAMKQAWLQISQDNELMSCSNQAKQMPYRHGNARFKSS